jgi:hypothetical protein
MDMRLLTKDRIERYPGSYFLRGPDRVVLFIPEKLVCSKQNQSLVASYPQTGADHAQTGKLFVSSTSALTHLSISPIACFARLPSSEASNAIAVRKRRKAAMSRSYVFSVRLRIGRAIWIKLPAQDVQQLLRDASSLGTS